MGAAKVLADPATWWGDQTLDRLVVANPDRSERTEMAKVYRRTASS
jgi:hypothetical protein